MGDTAVDVLRAYQLRNHRMVRVLLLDPFRSSSRTVHVPVSDTDTGDYSGIDLQAIENVLRLHTARHSYRELSLRAVQALHVELSPSRMYRFVSWNSGRVMRVPGFVFSFKPNDKSTIVGSASGATRYGGYNAVATL